MHRGTDVNLAYGYDGDGLAPHPSVTIPTFLRDLRSPLAAVSCKFWAEQFAPYLCCAGQQLPSATIICKVTTAPYLRAEVAYLRGGTPCRAATACIPAAGMDCVGGGSNEARCVGINSGVHRLRH